MHITMKVLLGLRDDIEHRFKVLLDIGLPRSILQTCQPCPPLGNEWKAQVCAVRRCGQGNDTGVVAEVRSPVEHGQQLRRRRTRAGRAGGLTRSGSHILLGAVVGWGGGVDTAGL